MKRTLTLLIILTFGALQLMAVPAKRGFRTVRQSDGSELKIQVHGDEFFHYTTTEDGYTVAQDADGDYCYAQASNGRLVSSGVKVGRRLNADQQAVALKSRGIRPARMSALGEARAARNSQNAAMLSPAKAAQKFGIWGGEVSGELKGLVILVNFSDKSYVTSSPKTAFSEMLNTKGYSKNGATGSATDYFVDNSSGKFTPSFDVYGPYTLPNTSAYYAGDGESESVQNMRGIQMIIDACKRADADVNFADYAESGKVRSVFVYYAGHNQAEGGGTNTVWPHQFAVYTQTLTLDGVRIYDYACTSELRDSYGSNMAGIGTFCHEFGHVLGLPDFYDTDDEKNGTSFGLLTLSIMDYGSYLNDGRTPPSYTIMERWMLGWGEPTVISANGTYTLSPVYDNTGYIISTPTTDEYFLMENRCKASADKWDYYLLNGDSSVTVGGNGGDGMIVYHVDFSSTYRSRWNNNEINAYSNHECMKLLRAVPTAGSSKSPQWFYPGSANVTQLTSTSTPSLTSWSGSAADYQIANISKSGKNIVLSIGECELSNLAVDQRQYDALLTWKSSYAEYDVEFYPTKSSSDKVRSTVTGQFCMLDNLTPATAYTVNITPKGGEASYKVEFTTDKSLVSKPARLNVDYEHSAADYVRLSAEHLKTTPTEIVWYVDGVKSSSYVKLSVGIHTVSMVATSAEGNEYLFRYIEIK